VGPALPALDLGYLRLFFVQAFPRVLVDYLRLLIVPWNLHSHRMMPSMSHAWPLYLAAVVGFGLWALWTRRRLAFFCWAWFIVNFLPRTPAMIYGNFRLDHWAYPALVSLVLPLGIWFSTGWERREDRRQRWMGVIFVPLLVAWALLAQLNIALRDTDEKLYRWALNFTESNPVKANLGILYVQTGRPFLAISYLEEAHAAYPENANITNALARAYFDLHQAARSRRLLESYQAAYPPSAVIEDSLRALRQREPPKP
jgi:tetratricopeptide (TPR) repeat protein